MTATALSILSVMLGLSARLAMSQLPGYNGLASGLGIGHTAGYGHGLGMGAVSPPVMRSRMLSCEVMQADGRRLGVTISENQNNGMYGVGGHPNLALSPVFGAFAGLGAGWGLHGNGLDIDIEVFLLRNIGTAYFALTEFASPSSSTCSTPSFGKILSPSGGGHASGYAGVHSIAGMSPLHTQGGFIPVQAGGSFRESSVSAPGIVTTSSVTAGVSQTFKVTSLEGFNLEELAGRGFIVCDSVSYDWDWQPVCDTPVVDVCCGLTYSNGAGSRPTDNSSPDVYPGRRYPLYK